ncbi:MAG: transglutaminase domain-containing protein, partial [Lachnospiraceae bacterium]|nr:transglutaminase domain-containing protein [Lachnospiraceae bacterium]
YYKFTANPEMPNDIRTFTDVIVKSMSEYYGFHWDGFGAGSDATILIYKGVNNTVLTALVIFYLPFTTLLGYSMIRKFRFTSVALALLFPCFFTLMNGYMPDRISFLLLIFLFAVLAVLGVQMKIEEKQQVVVSEKSGNDLSAIFCLRPPKAVIPLFGISFATLLAAMAFPPMLEDRLTEAIKPAQEFMYSGGPEKLLKNLRGKLFGASAGGISGGDLSSTGIIKPDKDHVLLTVYRSNQFYYRYSYLKCYVGEVYTGSRWTDLPNVIRKQYSNMIPGAFSRREYYRLDEVRNILESSWTYNPGDKNLMDTLKITPSYIYITNVDYVDGYRVMPYLMNLPDNVNLALNPYVKEESQSGSVTSYDFMYLQIPNMVRLYDAYCHDNRILPGVTDSPQNLADAFYNKLYRVAPGESAYPMETGKAVAGYLFQYDGDEYNRDTDASYAELLKEYLVVPDSVKQLREHMKGVRLDGVEDAVIYVRETLSNMAEYSLSPGKIESGRDFVDTFLFEKKAGYCMHFATAGTIMFRLLGIPARYVEGFYLSPSTSEEQMITEENAHAWVEIYLKNFGWVPIEVTPGFGDREDWRKWETERPKPTQPDPTQASTTTPQSSGVAETETASGSQEVETHIVVGPGHSMAP